MKHEFSSKSIIEEGVYLEPGQKIYFKIIEGSRKPDLLDQHLFEQKINQLRSTKKKGGIVKVIVKDTEVEISCEKTEDEEMEEYMRSSEYQKMKYENSFNHGGFP